MIRRFLAATALVAISSLPSHAQAPALQPEPAPAGTADGAAALRKTLATYLTDLPFSRGIVRIEPDPAGQRITFDPTPVLSDFPQWQVRVRPLSYLVSERADGTWNVFSRDPLDMAVQARDDAAPLHVEYRQGAQTFKGIFSPALAAFLTAEGVVTDTINIQNEAASRSAVRIPRTVLSASTRPNEGGGVDLDVRQTYQGYEQTIEIPMPSADGAVPDEAGAPETPDEAQKGGETAAQPPALEIKFLAANVEANVAVTAARTVAFRDLYAVLVRHIDALSADPQATMAGPLQGELVAALGKVLPLWSSLKGDGIARDVTISSMFGQLRLAEARQAIRFSGVDRNAGFDLDMGFTRLQADSALLPPWSKGLMPQEIDLGFAVAGVDLKTPADIALADVDFTKDPPLSPEVQARISASFDPTRITARLKPSRIRSADLDIQMSGDLSFPDRKPSARFAIEAAGIDKAIATLQSAAKDQPELQQSVGMLQIAKGFGRPKDDGRLEWIVAAAPDGSVTVNGTVMKGPDPVEPPSDEDAAPDTQEPDEGGAGASDL